MNALDALHNALRGQLIDTAGVTDLVPATAILDRHTLPAPDPSIIIGDHQAQPLGDVARTKQLITSTLHLWKREPSLAGVRAIAGVVRTAVQGNALALAAGYHCGDCRVTDMRFLRDPDGETSHGVVTIESLVSETD